MFGRQKALLYLIYSMKKRGMKITKTQLDKLLFLLKKESKISDYVKFYNFYPYNFGPFSNQFYFDLNDLASRGIMTDQFEFNITNETIETYLKENEKKIIDQTIDKFRDIDIIEYTYEKYPEYTTKSLLKTQKRNDGSPGIFSIGYEKKDIDLFLDILIQNTIDIVVDVRANPFSMNFSFTKTKLTNYLKKAGIEYLHIPELGIKGEHRKNLENDADYDKLFEFYQRDILPNQIDKVKQLKELGKSKRIALLCFEQDKDHCHRGILSKFIEKEGMMVTHL
jgi:uncharacterized protein (DUF488 family)